MSGGSYREGLATTTKKGRGRGGDEAIPDQNQETERRHRPQPGRGEKKTQTVASSGHYDESFFKCKERCQGGPEGGSAAIDTSLCKKEGKVPIYGPLGRW